MTSPHPATTRRQPKRLIDGSRSRHFLTCCSFCGSKADPECSVSGFRLCRRHRELVNAIAARVGRTVPDGPIAAPPRRKRAAKTKPARQGARRLSEMHRANLSAGLKRAWERRRERGGA